MCNFLIITELFHHLEIISYTLKLRGLWWGWKSKIRHVQGFEPDKELKIIILKKNTDVQENIERTKKIKLGKLYMDSFMSLFLFNKDIWLKHTWKHRNSGAKVYNNWTENLIESFYSRYNQPEARITVLKERCSKIIQSQE